MAAGLAVGAELGVCAEAEVEITDKGRARTAALAKMYINFSHMTPVNIEE